MIQKVLKKILLWLFDSGNNEVFAKAINDIENEIIQKNKVMKANEAPEKIYIQPNAHDGWFESNPHNNIFVEYIRKDTFIEKADKFISSFFHPDDTELKKVILDEFHKYIKGEEV